MRRVIIVLAVVLIAGSIVIVRRHQMRQERLQNYQEQNQERREDVLNRMQERRTKDVSQISQASLTLGAGDYEYSFRHGDRERYYLLHVPALYSKEKATPLVLFFHGGGGDREQASRDYGWKEKADKEGFIVAFGNGVSRFPKQKIATWNAGNCCGEARDSKVDDIGYVRAMVSDIESKFFIDDEKIFATGMSNGGMLSQRLACDATDLFKAVAPVAATDNTITCNPTRPISIIEFHAKDDDHVLFGGGAGTEAFRNPDQVTDFTSVPETLSRWIKRNQSNAEPRRVVEKPGAYCDLYTSSLNTSQIELCVTDTGGHSWPGSQPVRGKQPSQAISANDIIWDFFMQQK